MRNQRLDLARWTLGAAFVALLAMSMAPNLHATVPAAEKTAVLAANTAFYTAFREQDVEAMDGLWARSAQASVIHPGWNSIVGRGNVMRSWRDIIVSGGAPKIYPLKPTVTFHGGTATVICYEKIANEYLVATNIFVKENGTWLLVHHHAGSAPTAAKLFKGDPA